MSKILKSICSLIFLLCFLSNPYLNALSQSPSGSSELPQKAIPGDLRIGLLSEGCLAVWQEYKDKTSSIQSALLPKESEWVGPLTVSSHSLWPANVELAVNFSTAIAVWEEGENVENGTSTVKAAHFSSGTWSSPVDLSTPAPSYGQFPQIALNSRGFAVAVWRKHNGNTNIVQASTLNPEGTWSAAVDISLPEVDASFPRIAMDYEGNTNVVWMGNGMIQAANSRAGGQWTCPVNLSPSSVYGSPPRIAINAYGSGVAAWGSGDGSNYTVQASTFSGSNWTTPVAVSEQGISTYSIDVAIDSGSNAMVVWSQSLSNETSAYIYASYKQASSAAWPHPTKISSPGTKTISSFAINPKVTFDYGPNAYVVWVDHGVEAAIFSNESKWSKVYHISPPVENLDSAQIAVGGVYNVISWSDINNGSINAAKWMPIPMTYPLYLDQK